jgi:Arc/MetJ-type ribon-helix-helix transcriptional regulator
MKHHEERIAVRLPSKQRQQINELIETGKFKNLSEVIRSALKEFICSEGRP